MQIDSGMKQRHWFEFEQKKKMENANENRHDTKAQKKIDYFTVP